ncbi:MAG: hypothetical protein KC427_07375, partial [Sulfurovum sp.]|nr:hypothetical protein [Sulfurovum sp.]
MYIRNKIKVTREKVKEVLVEADILGDISEIKSNIPLIEQGIDSLDTWTVYLLLEEEFCIKIPDEDL